MIEWQMLPIRRLNIQLETDFLVLGTSWHGACGLGEAVTGQAFRNPREDHEFHCWTEADRFATCACQQVAADAGRN